jgi:hypothetical protein
VPLHSTCEDVKRLLGVTTCGTSTYHLNDETATIIFSEKPCVEGWEVPTGTVLTIDVHPKPSLKLVDLRIDEGRFKKVADQHLEGVVYYTDDEEGVSITAFADGSVGGFFYGPAARDNALRCFNSSAGGQDSSGNSHGSIKFDEYGDIPSQDEKTRLDRFAFQLQAEPKTQGYIIAYGGQNASAEDARARADCAKNYLIDKKGIEREQLVTVEGGYREELTVELFIRLSGGNAPVALPTVRPSDVQLTGDDNLRNRRRAIRPCRYE